MGLVAAAEEHRGADVPEMNAMGMIAAHAACEAMLGLIIGPLPFVKGKPVDERYFPELLGLAAARARPRLSQTLQGDLGVMHHVRNGFVHGGQSVDVAELDRAIDAAHSLAEHVPMPGNNRLVGIATVVADVIDIEAIGMWLRHADRMKREGHIHWAADGIARALDAALDRTVPRVRHRRDIWAARDFAKMISLSGGRGLEADLRSHGAAISELTDWVYPMALGISPATLAYVRSVVGKESGVDIGGHPQPVSRPTKKPPSDRDYRRASTIVARMILRLSVMGSLSARKSDPDVVAIAQDFLVQPSGLGASGYGSA